MRLILCLVLALVALAGTARADLAGLLVQYGDQIAEPRRQSVGEVIAALVADGDPALPRFLTAWEARDLGRRKADGAIFILSESPDGWALTDPVTGAPAGTAARADIDPIRPNAGVRGVIAAALVQFQLSDPDPAARVAAIDGFGADLGLDLRGALNPLVATRRIAAPAPPEGANIAAELTIGREITAEEAFDLLAASGAAPERLSRQAQRDALAANIADGAVGGVPVADLSDPAARDRAYTALEQAGAVPTAATADEIAAAVAASRYFDVYVEPDPAVTAAAAAALSRIATTVGAMQAADLALDAVSLASIYFLAAIGLAITFGVMRVINMAHGEFIMLGAYTGYVVQQVVADYTLSIALALPLAFAVTFAAGVAMERLVIRHLYRRPLETLLATFGISIALQQLAKNIFGTQARPLTAPAWLDGALTFNDVVSISYIRVAIFVLALIFLAFFLYMMKRTRLGLEVRAVQQNPSMAASMGINPDRINMLTFGLGSGIAGIAGVAIGLFAQVTSEIGSAYIVQSFMTVVVGGVGSIWGTLAGAALIGGLQKVIEFLNPSNTLAAQTWMILFIILFIQVRPRGIVALRGRAAGD